MLIPRVVGDAMTVRLAQMSDQEVKDTWAALGYSDWVSKEEWGDGFTMEDWCEAVYSEIFKRGLATCSQEE